MCQFAVLIGPKSTALPLEDEVMPVAVSDIGCAPYLIFCCSVDINLSIPSGIYIFIME